MSGGRLIVLSGLPGVGKSTLARALAEATGAIWLRIDSIEQAIRDAGIDAGEAGYRVGHAVAADNLRSGRDIIADCVNGWMLTRDGWAQTARAAGAELIEIEIVCSDRAEHRRRVETRSGDIRGHIPPRWEAIEAQDYHPWTRPPLRIDTAGRSIEASAAALIAALFAGSP